MKKNKFIFILAVTLLFSVLSFSVYATHISSSNVSVVLLGNHGTATVASSYSESTGLVWQNDLVNGNKVGTDTINHIISGPFNDTNLKAGYLVTATDGYYIDGFYRSQADYTNHKNSLDNIDDFSDTNLYTLNTQGYLTRAILTEITFPNDTVYISFAKIPAPDTISVILLGNHGTATVANSYSESNGLVWQNSLVNGNKVGTDTIKHILAGPFNDTNLKAGYNVKANEGYYIDGFYRSKSDYENGRNSLGNIKDFSNSSLYKFDTSGNLIEGVLTEVTFPNDTFYISFAEIKSIIKNTNSATKVKFEAASTRLPQNTILNVEKIASGENFNKINIVVGDNKSKMAAYNISLTSNGVKVQPNGYIKVYLPIPNDFDTSNLTVYYVNTETKAKESFKVTVETIDNVKYAVFETNHFSTYVLASKTQEANPQTYDGIETYFVLGILSILAICGLAVYTKKKRLN